MPATSYRNWLCFTTMACSLGSLLAGACYHSPAAVDDGTGCKSDLDCKGDRICVEEICVDPDGGSALPKFDDDVEGGEDAQELPAVCKDGAKAYADKTADEFCPISLLVLVDNSAGVPVMTEAQVMAEVAYINEYLADSYLALGVIGVEEYTHDPVIDAQHSELTDDEITAARDAGHVVLAFAHHEAITEYICGRATIGGYGALPAAIVDASCVAGEPRRQSALHEIGHVLGLRHTHSPFNPNPPDDEEPDPSQVPALDADCYTTGDRICDTPVDPTAVYCPVEGCTPKCDELFEGYTPLSTLAMSYYDDDASCQTPELAFSQEQINVMRCVSREVLPETANCQGCVPAKYTKCADDGDLYYYDSCGKIGQLAQSCDDGNPCTADACSDDGCDNEAVADGMDCGGGKVCKSGSCVVEGEQQCDSGDCCSGGVFRPASFVCTAEAETELGCPYGTNPGDDVAERTRDRYCSGTSSACDGAFGPWSGWAVADDCSADEVCVPGGAVCQAAPCSDTYQVDAYECPAYSSADGVGAGGGDIFQVCGDVNSATGLVTISATKYDGTTFGDRPYQVRVSGDGTEDCGPDANFFIVVDEDPLGIGSKTLTFEFQSTFLEGQTEKNYCVTASTQNGDLGYNDADPLQKSWWWSRKVRVTKTCL